MNDQTPTRARVTPILTVRDFAEAVEHYTKTLHFELQWNSGDPPEFGCVALDKAEIFLCQGGQGQAGTWLMIFMDNVDAYCEQIMASGAEIVQPPTDQPWGCREMLVRDPNEHVIRFAHAIPTREPKLEVERAELAAPIEKRLLALVEDLARHKGMTVGETLEETLLHSFEPMADGAVASPHTPTTLDHIQGLRTKHGIDYDAHASYRFVDRSPAK